MTADVLVFSFLGALISVLALQALSSAAYQPEWPDPEPSSTNPSPHEQTVPQDRTPDPTRGWFAGFYLTQESSDAISGDLFDHDPPRLTATVTSGSTTRIDLTATVMNLDSTLSEHHLQAPSIVFVIPGSAEVNEPSAPCRYKDLSGSAPLYDEAVIDHPGSIPLRSSGFGENSSLGFRVIQCENVLLTRDAAVLLSSPARMPNLVSISYTVTDVPEATAGFQTSQEVGFNSMYGLLGLTATSRALSKQAHFWAEYGGQMMVSLRPPQPESEFVASYPAPTIESPQLISVESDEGESVVVVWQTGWVVRGATALVNLLLLVAGALIAMLIDQWARERNLLLAHAILMPLIAPVLIVACIAPQWPSMLIAWSGSMLLLVCLASRRLRPHQKRTV